MYPNLFEPPEQLFPLRPRQQAVIDAVRQAIRDGHKRIVVQAPTGSGKTIVASHIIAGALDKGKRPLFTVPQLSLIEQTIRRFEAQGICDIGVIQAQHARTDGNARVQIASIQTLVRRPLPDVDFVLIDEIHLQFEALHKILDSEAWANKIVIGLSATPWAKGMGRRWSKLVPFGTTQELIAESWLTPLVAYGVPDDYMPDMTQVRTVAGEYVEDDAEQAMTTAPIVGNVVATWKAKHGGAFTFMFCVNRSHARKMQKEFEEAGVPCGYIDGTMDADQRERVFEKYRSGEYKIIASVGCLIVGVDERVECIIFLVLTKSEMKWVQAGGRGLRLADGKDHLLLLDHSGTCEALGLFTDIHHETLDMHDPKEKGQPFQDKKPPKPYKCKACNAIVPKGREVCPICGAKMPKAPTPRQVDGELVEVKGGKAPKKSEKAPKKSERVYTMAEKQEFYSGLLYIAQQRGKAEGVAAHRYRDKFGAFPRGLQKVPSPPSFEVSQFDKHCRIKWAKSMISRDKMKESGVGSTGQTLPAIQERA
ncbi:MAG: DEAD/DEAH box helicase [Terriglobia bacterium]|nr:DEAD/DEAH box helicase [Terriglobia bacterium]